MCKALIAVVIFIASHNTKVLNRMVVLQIRAGVVSSNLMKIYCTNTVYSEISSVQLTFWPEEKVNGRSKIERFILWGACMYSVYFITICPLDF